MAWFGCKTCSASDKVADTVRVVDPTLLSSMAEGGQVVKSARGEAETVLQEKEEEGGLHPVEEQQCAEEQQEAEECRPPREEEQEEAEQAEEQQRLQLEAAVAEQARRREKAQEEEKEASECARAAREKEQQETAQAAAKAQKQVDAFLRAEGFKSIVAPRKNCCRTSFALHRAVEENDAELVLALLRCGADQTRRNSAGQTPHELAQRRNRKGSHELILAALSSGDSTI